jgi:hypothetical protein
MFFPWKNWHFSTGPPAIDETVAFEHYLCRITDPMKSLLAFLFLLCGITASAQYDPNYKFEEPENPFNLGLGIGLDYGGIGAKFSGFPVKNFGVFAGVGYNLMKVGYNFGGTVRILPAKKVCPILTGMYGYNGVIVVDGGSQYNKVYYGPSFGGGIELHFSNRQNFMNFGLLIPIRPQSFYDDIDALKVNPAISGITDPPPFGISVGYHFKLQ